MNSPLVKEKVKRPRLRFLSALGMSLSIGLVLSFGGTASAGEKVSQVVNVDFTNLVVDGAEIANGTVVANGSTITNEAADKTADLTTSGAQTFSTADGLEFQNTANGNTINYLMGNLGPTSELTTLEILISAKFPDTGCAAQEFGSMLFGLGTSGNYSKYNIYRHSNFIGFNTFTSELYGVSLPDNTDFHDYKFVMASNSLPIESSEIWIDGVKQNLSFKNTDEGNKVAPCSAITGTNETLSERLLATETYTNGDFMLMTHPLGASNWGTTGTLKSVIINTVVPTEDPVEEPTDEPTEETDGPTLADTGSDLDTLGLFGAVFVVSGLALFTLGRIRLSRARK